MESTQSQPSVDWGRNEGGGMLSQKKLKKEMVCEMVQSQTCLEGLLLISIHLS